MSSTQCTEFSIQIVALEKLLLIPEDQRYSTLGGWIQQHQF
ncbi:hypothetical protein [Nostoc sp. CHAB 5836]|nr:hypothetical protein [Nostoc sp. CHAB 5836]